MKTLVIVDAEALKRVLNYIMDDEEHDYLECEASGWTKEELKHHVYMSLTQLEKDFVEGAKYEKV
jgi:hypothetical protein